MNLWPESALLLFTAGSCLGLGVTVFALNPQRRTHQAFAAMALNLMLWTLCVLAVIHSHRPERALFWIQMTFAVACFLPATYYTFAGLFPRQRFEGFRPLLTFLWAVAFVLSGLSFSRWYLQVGDLLVLPGAPPIVLRYGPVFHVFSALILLSTSFSFGNLVRKLRSSSGIERRQIQMVILGVFLSAGLALLTNIIGPLVGVRHLEAHGPNFLVLMVVVFAYAMIRYHLLDMWVLFTRTSVYAIVTSLVALIFVASVSFVRLITGVGDAKVGFWSAVLAALVVSLVLQPIKERLQLTLNRALLKRQYDLNRLLARVSQNAAETVRLDELLKLVADDIQKTVGVSLFRVLLVDDKDPSALVTEYSSVPGEQGRRLLDHGALIKHMRIELQPLVLEKILHERPTEARLRTARHLAELGAFLCVPLKNSAGLVGMMTLGQKTSKDIYSTDDLMVFTALAGPLGTAIENARLYRQLEEVNLHRARILSHMRGGVIAVDTEGRISTVNQAAQDILGPIQLGQHYETLVSQLAEVLAATLEQERGVSDFEVALTSVEGEPLSVAVSSSCLKTAGNVTVGAMVLINDLTAIKRLEQNVQRADRLSSLGTLAAGMAHEIKNPLVSIKTFTQLLLERYEDPDFRSTFAEVVPHEVERIDSIVLRLLDFARPKAPRFAPHNLRSVIDNVLALVDNELRKACIAVEKDVPEEYPEVYGDEQQLHQVFLNLVLNAIHAMKEQEGGTLRIRAEVARRHLRQGGFLPFYEEDCAQIFISDTGYGIAPENLSRLFTPFFTTKPDGSGLGLAVVHGIVSEHGGDIDVRSTPGEGTTFAVTLPLSRQNEAATGSVGEALVE